MNWFIWIVTGIILSILELFTPGFFILGIGVSCAVTAIPSALHAPFWFQLITFAVALILFFTLIRPLVLKVSGKETPSGTEAMIGMEGHVVESFSKGEGRIRVRGESWKARSLDGENIEKDSLVVVTSLEGVTLIVERRN